MARAKRRHQALQEQYQIVRAAFGGGEDRFPSWAALETALLGGKAADNEAMGLPEFETKEWWLDPPEGKVDKG